MVSPCIGVCRLDPSSIYCVGCARSRAEIAAWGRSTADYRDRVMAELPERRIRLGLTPVRANVASCEGDAP
ncbi:DUF1289 domain-containing protein [Paludisphaera rhizosphaerae]|uniref:DUF1289 domain-containing protein n=1 Tax=Paludisphaera rhizosphaerae TaxID=2711216 RepID=UPI0013EA28EC